MKKLLAVLTALTLLLSLSAAALAADYTVGICQQMPHAALDSATQGFMDAMNEALGEGAVEFLVQNAQGDSTACTTIVNDFVTKKVDLILGNATTALQAAANGTFTIPVLGTSVTEYGTALGIKDFSGLVGGNVSGTSDLAPLDEQANMIVELWPQAKTVAMLYCSGEPNSAYQVKKVAEYLTEKGVACVDYPFADSNDIATVAKAAAAAADVIYIPTDNTAAACAEAINGAVLPTGTPIMGGDEGICGGCGIATLCINYYDLGVTTGKMAAKILAGEIKIEETPIAYAEKFSKVYNPDNCAELGVDVAALEAAGYTAIVK
ncbi:MAG: ABC transporter substrate-binding protein [Clostridia bacterium]|nr:ABC transporter substrate-binding protein [Clostridia bacterium]